MTVTAVSDAGPLIHLAEIDSLELLSVFETFLVPMTVHEEIERGSVPDGLEDLSFDLVESEKGRVSADELDAGERAALATAHEHDAVLLTDDLAARESASEIGIEVHGSVGVIALAYAHGFIDKADASSRMRALQRETSLFVTDAVIERGIDLLDEG